MCFVFVYNQTSNFQVFYSEEIHSVSVDTIEGSCQVRRKFDVPPLESLATLDHIFFCELVYDPSNGSLKQVYDHFRLYVELSILVEMDPLKKSLAIVLEFMTVANHEP